MGTFLNPADLKNLAPDLSDEKAADLIADVEANAIMEAPCIAEPGFTYRDQVKSILRQAVLRWNRAGEGGLSSTQEGTGPFQTTYGYDTRVYGEGRLLRSEIQRLKSLCRRYRGTGRHRQAFTVIPKG